jgi:hypothetical protein
MPDKPPKLPALGFAGFEDSSSARGRPRRRSTWSLRPTASPSEAATADAARFVSAAAIMQGIGRKPEGIE